MPGCRHCMCKACMMKASCAIISQGNDQGHLVPQMSLGPQWCCQRGFFITVRWMLCMAADKHGPCLLSGTYAFTHCCCFGTTYNTESAATGCVISLQHCIMEGAGPSQHCLCSSLLRHRTKCRVSVVCMPARIGETKQGCCAEQQAASHATNSCRPIQPCPAGCPGAPRPARPSLEPPSELAWPGA